MRPLRRLFTVPEATLSRPHPMSLFARPHYRSDATEFLDALKGRQPELEAQQRQGRALLWDQPIDRQFWQQADAAKVAQKPYVYQTEPTLKG
jgi:hypothetical protein